MAIKMPNKDDAIAAGIDAYAMADRYNRLSKVCDKGCDSLGIADAILCRIKCIDLLKLENWWYKHAEELNAAMGDNRRQLEPGQSAADRLYLGTFQKYNAEGKAAAAAALDELIDRKNKGGWTPALAAQIQALFDVVNGRPCNPRPYSHDFFTTPPTVPVNELPEI
ncbi:hypothetical protein [Smaragdicoccus niigatensis]|uniref:hypothetical protein n=1 Tax=Smaragdicoccus niigatensis TaxID=359359 RepID=UPI00036FD2FC|nr:hypothetical protein [Smaragdicoccus niigatensis]